MIRGSSRPVAALFVAAVLLAAGCGDAPEASPAPGDSSAPGDPPAPEEQVRRVIETEGAPAAIGPYSQAVQVGSTLYLAGQLGMDPVTGALGEGGIEAETRRALDNLAAVLEAAGFTLSDVVQSQVFLADLEEFGAMNAIYAEYFPEAPPARATVQVARLPLDGRIEIQLVAERGR